jgi:hypothetical protein
MATRTIDILTTLAFDQQSAYGTALPEASMTFVHAFEGENFAKETYEKVNDADKYGKGTEFPVGKQLNLTADVQLSRTVDLSSAVAGFLFGFAFGTVTTTLVVGTTKVYKHEFIPMNIADILVGKQLPVTGYLEQNEIEQKFYRDMLMKSVKLTGAEKKQVQAAFEMQGSGYWEVTEYTMPDYIPLSYLRTADCTFTVGATDISGKLKNFEFSWTNEVNPDQYNGGPKLATGQGEFRCRKKMTTKKRKATLTFKMDYEDNDIREDMLLNTERAVTLTAEGDIIETVSEVDYRHKLEIICPKAEFDKADITSDNGELALDCSTLLKYDSTLKAPCKVIVYNDIPAYLDMPGA